MFELAVPPEAPPDVGPVDGGGWAEPVDADTRALLDGLAATYAAAPAAGMLPSAVEELPPGPDLARVLAAVEIDAADGWDLVEAAALVQRLAAWVDAKQAQVLTALAARPELRPVAAETGFRSVHPITNSAVVVAGRCQLTARQAEYQVGHSVQLVEDFPDTWAALLAGLIDLRRARVITDQLGGQEPHVRRRVEAAVLPRAPFLDSVALRKLIQQLLHELAPVEAAERHAVARESRYVAVTAASDAMAHLEARLPAEDAIALNTALNTAAADLKRADAAAGGPVRTTDQRRADVLAGLAWTALAPCADPATHAATHGTAGRDHPAAHDTSNAANVANATNHAADVTGVAAVGGAGRSVGRREVGVVRGATGAMADGLAGHLGVGVVGRATGGPTDGTVAGPPASITTGRPGEPADPVATTTATSATSTGTGGAAPRRRPVSVHVTIPFGSLTGLSDEPGELEGYGPIPAPIARTLAAEGVWTWLRTDPGTGQLLDLGRTTYRPSTALADFVTARDRTCRMPGCHRPARAGDIDHIVPFGTGAGGTTNAANCHSLCETHHLLKHHGGWRVQRQPDGTTRWTSPTGHAYDRPPERIGPVNGADPPG